MDNLDRKLRTTLESSANTTTTGRQQIDQIINQVNSAIQAMSPILNTPAGQATVVGAITTGSPPPDPCGPKPSADGLQRQHHQHHGLRLHQGPPRRTPATTSSPVVRTGTVLASATGDNHRLGDKKSVGRQRNHRSPRHPQLAARTADHGQTRIRQQPTSSKSLGLQRPGGDSSKGWMQTIEPTFNAHWRPGTSRNIFDPVANAAAAIHYVMTRYGSPPTAPT